MIDFYDRLTFRWEIYIYWMQFDVKFGHFAVLLYKTCAYIKNLIWNLNEWFENDFGSFGVRSSDNLICFPFHFIANRILQYLILVKIKIIKLTINTLWSVSFAIFSVGDQIGNFWFRDTNATTASTTILMQIQRIPINAPFLT